jgi:hypothetical protein
MELLKSLFENAELPADFKEKTTTLFEAAVDEKVKAELVSIQESYDTKLEESKAAFLAEAIVSVDAVIEEAILEWAKENAVALDSEVKGQIAESFLAGLKGIFEKADIELNGTDTAGKELVRLQEQNAELVKAADESKAALVEAEQKLTRLKVKEIIEQLTVDLADTQADRISKLCEAFDFKNEEDFRAKVAMVLEAVAGIKAVNNGTQAVPDGKKNTPQVDDESGVAGDEDGELVKKPTSQKNTSAEGADGKPTVMADPMKETYDAQQAEHAPHLHSDMVAETLKLFSKK